ncbi:hypothetical protein [Mesorhizobium sp. IMUNJ 23232]|uniref:hypothetical protein n=1 Tax=Mesorhizobium sp. IMUNJ 23232 TaxID=3376064 RepID=UPI00379FED50
MDGNAAIERNVEALKRILAMLVGMVEMGFGAGGQFTFFPQKGAEVQNEALAEKSKLSPALSPALTLPRHLYRAILRLLRPAESAARRLIIAAARGIVVNLPPVRPRKPKPKISDTVAAMRRLGLAVNLSKEDFARYEAERKAAERRAARPRAISLPLFDPPKYPFRVRRRHVPARGVPRIWVPGFSEPAPLPLPPSPDDPIDAARLGLRLAALGAALDDLPKQARRFARWKARCDAAVAEMRQIGSTVVVRGRTARGTVRFQRTRPLWPGRPPGGRLSPYNPTATHSRGIREVDEILAYAHALALDALNPMCPDTS